MLLAAIFLSPSLDNLTKVVVKKLISLAISNRQIDCDFHCKMRRAVKKPISLAILLHLPTNAKNYNIHWLSLITERSTKVTERRTVH